MSNDTPVLAVSIRELPAAHVASIDQPVSVEQGEFNQQIRDAFQRVQAFVRELGCDPLLELHIGVIHRTGDRLSSYECCVQVPDEVQAGTEGIAVKDLSGGRFAVLTIDKDPAIVGPSIDRFHQEYVPRHRLALDGARPTYEIYFERTMEYCVPLREEG